MAQPRRKTNGLDRRTGRQRTSAGWKPTGTRTPFSFQLAPEEEDVGRKAHLRAAGSFHRTAARSPIVVEAVPFAIAGFSVADIVAKATTAGMLDDCHQLVQQAAVVAVVSVIVEGETSRDTHGSGDFIAVPVESLQLDGEDIWAMPDEQGSTFHAAIPAFLALVALYNLFHVLVQVHGQRAVRKPGSNWDGERLVIMTRSP